MYDDGFRVADVMKNSVTATADGWETGVDAPDITDALAGSDVGPDEPPCQFTARTRELEFAPVFAAAIPVNRREQTSFGGSADEVNLPADDYLLRVETNVRVFIRVDGPVTLRRDNAEALWVEFPEPTPIGLAFGSHVDLPGPTMTVPETPEGVATALSHTSISNETRSPDRSWPTQRNRPPNIAFGEETDIPAAVAREREETGIELVVPPDVEYLLTAASLVHYLGADVAVESGVEPHLDVDGYTATLPELPEFPDAAADLLERVFYLDCVARGAGPHGGPLSVSDTFDTLELDAERLYDAPLAERVRSYLAADYETVAEAFPEWHLALHVAPEYRNVAVLPYVLDDLPLFLRPKAEPLTRKEWLRYSMTGGGFEYQPRGEESTIDAYEHVQVSNIDLVRPTFERARTHGWLAPSVPSDGFDALPEGYENRDRYLDANGDPLSITAVVNDSMPQMPEPDGEDGPTMADEGYAISDEYEVRSDGPEVDLTIKRRIHTHELAEVFESRNDLVHFIGHHEEGEGLLCPDGELHHESIAESNARTFFLNACGSYPFARHLVERGSVAGAATFERVSNTYAVEIGSTFARLLVHGFSIQRALDKAAQHSIAPRDYVVLGDGTYSIAQHIVLNPTEMWIFQRGTREFEMLSEKRAYMAGGETKTSLKGTDESYHLMGQGRLDTVSVEELEDFIPVLDFPVVFKQELYWPEDLEEILGEIR
jgi:hypothetical protein